MAKIKVIIRLIIFSALFVAFLNFIIYGKNGIKSYLSLKKEIVFEEQKVCEIKQEIEKVKSEIFCFENDNFYLEKVARENLLMGSPDELVYLI